MDDIVKSQQLKMQRLKYLIQLLQGILLPLEHHHWMELCVILL